MDIALNNISAMVRFLCFNAHVQPQRLRKTVEPSVEAMSKSLQDPSQIQAPKNTSMKPSSLDSDFQITGGANDVGRSLSVEGKSKSEEITGKFSIKSGRSAHQTRIMKKSQSLGGRLCHEGRILLNNDAEVDIEQGFSGYSLYQNGLSGVDGSKVQRVSPTSECQKNESIFSIGDPQCSNKASPQNFDAILSGDSPHQNGLAGVDGSKDQRVSPTSECQKNDFIFTIGDPWHSDKASPENFDPILFGEVDRSPPMTIKSYYMPTLGLSTSSGQCSSNYLHPHSRSSEDLHVLNIRRKEISVHEGEKEVMGEHGRDDCMCKTEKNNHETSLDDDYESCNYSAFAKDWIIPVMDEMNLEKNVQGESFVRQGDEVPSKNFKIKRIEEWVIDLQHCFPLEETIELPDVNNLMKRHSTMLNAAKVDVKITSGIEAAKRCISTLSPFSAAAQLSNHGLAVIPFLGAFVSLKMLNLSGNSIARITAGALPRGLHVLNLSKNNISTIEGLRDLSRLRVLDLSYNRIMRIAHGLASCSSLKELYLAGNKISEVEGLHRLLKLTALDLRFNKIYTAKCLGQLAANYKSLQAICLEGNPAQKNVGDEQLKKYLLGLLPHLVYFNRQQVKASTLKDATERSVRLGISAHQFDCGLRSDNKVVRKVGHGLADSRPASSSVHGRNTRAVTSSKRFRGRHILLPPAGTKAKTGHRQPYNYDLSSKIFNLKSELSMHRSRSEGTLAAL